MDEWQYVEREVITDPKGRQWTVALMDVLGQEGDPDMPNKLLEVQYSSGRYFTLIYADGGALQHERGYASLDEATSAYDNLLVAVIDGSLDPSQPVFRQDLED
jgi:putative sterol carrier protein